MFSRLSTFSRSAIMALGLLSGMTGMAAANPVSAGIDGVFVPPIADPYVSPARDEFRGGYQRRWREGGRHFDRGDWRRHDDRRGWRDGGQRWDRRDWRRDDWRRDDWRRYNRRPSVYLDLEIAPRRYIAPRRQYRVNGLSGSHVAWCSDRYRSYRAWDNSFQPNHGARRQCYSPYI